MFFSLPSPPWDLLDIQKLDTKGVYRLFQNSQRWSFKKCCGNLFENYQKSNKLEYLSKGSLHYLKAETDVQQLHRSSAQIVQGNDECLEYHYSASNLVILHVTSLSWGMYLFLFKQLQPKSSPHCTWKMKKKHKNS